MVGGSSSINEAFESYADEFASLMEQIRQLASLQEPPVSTVSAVASNPEQQHQLRHSSHSCDTDTVDVVVKQAQELLQQMAVEARGIDNDATTRQHCMDRIKVYKSQWQSAKLHVDQQALMQRRCQRTENDTSVSMAARQNAVLAQAMQSIQETEQVAVDITANLAENRETLDRTAGHAKEMRSLTATANQITTNLLKPWWRKGI
jgi:hypothetical protein